MENNHQLQQLSQRAERLFAKKSYAAAKKEFERILSLFPDEDVRDKIRICNKELLLQQRKDQIKKGRRLEKKGDLAGALDCFTRAAAIETEPWLEDKMAQLRQRLEASQVASVVEQAAREESPEKRLSAYEIALAHGSDPDLMEKKAGCLVEMERYEQVIDLYGDRAPQSVQGRYDFGYALIACGRYLQGLTQWEPLLPDYPALFPQVITILPCLVRELARGACGYALPYRILSDPGISRLEKHTSEVAESLDRYRRYFRFRYLKELWHTEDYAKIPELLPSQPRLRDVPLLARLYLNLAESNLDYLKVAITCWLTIIHSRRYSSPRADAADSAQSPRSALPDELLAPLEEQIATHTRLGRVTLALKAHWQAERRWIEALAAFFTDPKGQSLPAWQDSDGNSLFHGYDEYFPCTPTFAREFGLSDTILRLLREKKDAPNIDEQARLELHAGYSAMGQYMDWIEPGSEENIFNALPKGKNLDSEARYLYQRVALRCGINRIHAGGRHIRKFLQVALPLLETVPHLPQELIDLAYAETSEKVISSLSEAMEFLARHLKQPRFLEATAHCIGIDVQNLLLQGVSVDVVEKRLASGLSIYPDSQQIQATRSLVLKGKNTGKINKALKSGNLLKAARVVRDSEDLEIEDMFFDAMEGFYSQLSLECEENEKNIFLNKLYEACHMVDEYHWLTEQLAEERMIRGIS
uniref:Tetratricopeptide repeat-containing protein n=1 Tax=Candidatus Kentrum sp. LFY TaxID=2126342 RepID=A0A450V511_9GAMM|nr:MAG: hypothetical protein BECKLFY1418B_GA0070995_11621 [Candidatus Kentron sp. LFY]